MAKDKYIDVIMRYKNQLSSEMQKDIEKLRQQEKAMARVGGNFKKAGKQMEAMGKGLTAGVTLPVVGIGAASVKVAADFEQQMDRVGAIAGVTGKDLQPLTDQARELGSTTQFGAKEAAAGMENLASAGFNVNEIMGSMPGLLNLAAVSGGDIAASAEQAASAYRAFGMTDPSQMTHISDVFARAAADTNAEAADMGEALKMVAPVAHSMGISLEETAAAIGVMSDAGIKGSQAGTSLRGAISRLTKPTKAMSEVMGEYGLSFYDAQGNMLPLQDQLGMMKKNFAGLTQEQKSHALTTLYGQNSVAGMLALIDKGPQAFGELTQSLKDSDGAAKKMADEMNDNLTGKVKAMKSALESAGITIGTALSPAIGALTDKIKSAVQWFDNLSPKQQGLIIKMAGIAAAIGPVLLITGKLTTGLGNLMVKMSKTGSGFGALGRLFMANPIGIVVTAIAALVLGLVYLYNTNEGVRKEFQKTFGAIKKAFAPVLEELKPIFPYIKKFAAFLRDVVLPVVGKGIAVGIRYAAIGIAKGIQGVIIAVKAVVGFVKGAIAVIGAVVGGIVTAFNAVKTFITVTVPGFFVTAGQKVMDFWVGIGSFFSGIFTGIVDIFKSIGTTVGSAVAGAFRAVVNAVLAGVQTVLNAPINALNAALGIINKIPGVDISLIPTFQLPRLARGTMDWPGGPAMVHERGGEIIDLPRGSRVYPHDQSVKMARAGGGKVINIHIAKLADSIVVREDSDIDRIADRVADRIAERLDEIADNVAA
jgi:TP901 family phage tail tape measure protein